jgi:hypothetical protein
MRPVGYILAALSVAVIFGPATRGGGAKQGVTDAEAITKVVRLYFQNAASPKTVEKNADLFVKGDVCVVGIAKGAGRDKVWSKKVTDLLAEQKKELQKVDGDVPHKVDSVKVELVDKSLAAARVTYHNEFIKCRGVFTFTAEGGSWKIAAFVFETQYPFQK